MKKIKDYTTQIALSDSTTLIQGESGTGKELFARAIHNHSSRAPFPFIPINCAAIPEPLLESELFGYDEGAFSGAKKGGKPGKFEIADGGTIFLDEIGDMPLHMQAKLLRVLQEKRVDRIGGIRSIPVDVRIIAATNQNLQTMQEKKKFRGDLFFRLNVMPLNIPPLRNRRKDIKILARHFLSKHSKKIKNSVEGFTRNALNLMTEYDWPGNARELENAIEYALNIESETLISAKSLPATISKNHFHNPNRSLADRIREHEQSIIKETLDNHGKSVEGKELAARELGISLPTLYRKMKTL